MTGRRITRRPGERSKKRLHRHSFFELGEAHAHRYGAARHTHDDDGNVVRPRDAAADDEPVTPQL